MKLGMQECLGVRLGMSSSVLSFIWQNSRLRAECLQSRLAKNLR